MFTGFEIQNNQVLWGSLMAQMVKNLPAMQETQVRSIQNKPKRFIKKKKYVSFLHFSTCHQSSLPTKSYILYAALWKIKKEKIKYILLYSSFPHLYTNGHGLFHC